MMGSFVNSWMRRTELIIYSGIFDKDPFWHQTLKWKAKTVGQKFLKFETENEYSNRDQKLFLCVISKFLGLLMPTTFAKTIWNINFVSQHSKQYVVGLDPVAQLLDFFYHNISCSHMKQHVIVFSYKWQSFCHVIASSLPKLSKMQSVKSNLT